MGAYCRLVSSFFRPEARGLGARSQHYEHTCSAAVRYDLPGEMGVRMRLRDYIHSMRSLIGHKPLMLCGASVIVFDDERRVLMLRRSDNGCWCFPGGAIELGEKVEEAAAREVLEETGIEVGTLDLFGVFSGPELHHIYPNGDEVYIVDVVFSCNSFTGSLKSTGPETLETRFFHLTHLPSPYLPAPPLPPPAVPIRPTDC
jgi:8-oxo-dGTP pyrophosphatase MutT (NUDIX family)